MQKFYMEGQVTPKYLRKPQSVSPTRIFLRIYCYRSRTFGSLFLETIFHDEIIKSSTRDWLITDFTSGITFTANDVCTTFAMDLAVKLNNIIFVACGLVAGVRLTGRGHLLLLFAVIKPN